MKYLAFILMFMSAGAFANVPINKIDHNTIMTKDSMIILDKKESTFWKVETSCKLPITGESNVRFISHSRVIRKGSDLTFIIDSDRKNPHKCQVRTVAKV